MLIWVYGEPVDLQVYRFAKTGEISAIFWDFNGQKVDVTESILSDKTTEKQVRESWIQTL